MVWGGWPLWWGEAWRHTHACWSYHIHSGEVPSWIPPFPPLFQLSPQLRKITAHIQTVPPSQLNLSGTMPLWQPPGGCLLGGSKLHQVDNDDYTVHSLTFPTGILQGWEFDLSCNSALGNLCLEAKIRTSSRRFIRSMYCVSCTVNSRTLLPLFCAGQEKQLLLFHLLLVDNKQAKQNKKPSQLPNIQNIDFICVWLGVHRSGVVCLHLYHHTKVWIITDLVIEGNSQ